MCKYERKTFPTLQQRLQHRFHSMLKTPHLERLALQLAQDLFNGNQFKLNFCSLFQRSSETFFLIFIFYSCLFYFQLSDTKMSRETEYAHNSYAPIHGDPLSGVPEWSYFD